MPTRRWMAFALMLMVLPSTLSAQANPTLTEAERGIRRGDESGGDAAARTLRIDQLTVAAHVVGRTATVTLDLLIGSAGTEPFEAKLSLLLPADAVVTGYALDVGGRMIPGQLLENPRARNLYEAEVRKGIDPGLAEVSAGNRFTTRIFPIVAGQPRRFRVSFAAPFDPAIGLALPLARDTAIGHVAVSVRADGYATPPAVRFNERVVALTGTGAGWTGAMTLRDAVVRGGLLITGESAAPMVVTRHATGERFFAIADQASGTTSTAPGGRLRIYWDRSRSHRDDDIRLEAETLVRLVDLTAPAAIDLVTFASDRPTVMTVRDAAALRVALERVIYRGATSFAGLDALALPEASACVLVSDGQVTIDRAATLTPDCPLAVLTAATGSDGARLGRLARGAAVVRVGEGRAAAAAARLAQPSAIRSVRDDAGRPLGFRALPAPAGGWLLVGPMPASGDIRVRLTTGGERRYAATAPLDADAPGALWASQQVAALADDPARHAEMAAFSRRYGVAGPAMSLLVLETPDQYLQADLSPAAGFADTWMTEYRAAKVEHDAEQKNAHAERLTHVLGQWANRVTWWNTRFTPLPRAPRSKRDDDREAIVTPPPMVMSAPPPPTPVMTSPTAATEVSAAVAADNIVVTATRRADAPASATTRSSPIITLDLADLTARRPYIAALAAALPADRLRVLAEQERAYGSAPTFYLDTADWCRTRGDTATAMALLLSALELPLSDDETRQIVGFRLERDGAHDRAVELAEALAAANAGFRPQPARALALALATRGSARGVAGRADLERAFALLTQAALDPASRAFDGLEVIALAEANALIPAIEAASGRWSLDRRLVGRLDLDARIVMEWTADDADIDLWVDEPNRERVYYGEQLSSAGGQISNDMTDGYGPEEYAIRRAPAGAYQIRINGYDADRINPNGPGHVLIRLQRDFARTGAQQTLVDLDLSFQDGGDRDREDRTRPVATLRVER